LLRRYDLFSRRPESPRDSPAPRVPRDSPLYPEPPRDQ
jgi:hypothetical protein